MGYSFRIVFLILLGGALSAAGGQSAEKGNSSSETYLFPTNSSRQINSGFADFRASHFHGGIDISTNDEIGYPVYASKNGYVYRISVSPFGYGKMLVLRHDDSTFTLYGHLSAFSSPIERLVDSTQYAEENYSVDLRLQPNEIAVKRGQIIARTGATGVGGPHLHFEVHAKDYSFIDPLIYKSLDVPGYRDPKLFGVVASGYLSGKTVTRRVVRKMESPQKIRTFEMNEPFYFIVHAADSYGRGRFKRPPKRINLSIDKREFISVNLTEFSLGDYLDVSSLVDLSLSRGYETYYRLCVDRAIPFSIFTPDSSLSGIIGLNFSNGIHTYEITVADENGDSATATGKFDLEIPRRMSKGDPSRSFALMPIERFRERIVNPLPGLTLRFPQDCFAKNVDLIVVPLTSSSFEIEPLKEFIRKRIQVVWKVDDPKLQLYRKGRRSWIHIPGKVANGALSAGITYETGTFALLRDDVPPVIGPVRASSSNPFYRSVAPTEFNAVFVYFRVSDRMSGINTNRILMKLGDQTYLCEYDADMRSAICMADHDVLKEGKRVEVIASDNAGNVTTVYSTPRLRR